MIKYILCVFLTPLLYANYAPIENICEKFSREFTILNLASADGEFAFTTSEAFPLSKCIMTEDNNPRSKSIADKLLVSCTESESGNLPILLNKRFNNSDLKALSESSYFDIVAILGKNQYSNKRSFAGLEAYINVLLNLGWHTFIECKEGTPTYEILVSKDPVESTILENENTLFYFVKEKTSLKRKHLFGNVNHTKIKTTFSENIAIYNAPPPMLQRIMQRPPGINLINFLACYGAFPERDTLFNHKSNLRLNPDQDICPHEIFITNKGFKIASPYLPVDNEKTLTTELLTELINATTKAQIRSLLKTDLKPKS